MLNNFLWDTSHQLPKIPKTKKSTFHFVYAKNLKQKLIENKEKIKQEC